MPSLEVSGSLLRQACRIHVVPMQIRWQRQTLQFPQESTSNIVHKYDILMKSPHAYENPGPPQQPLSPGHKRDGVGQQA